jgi:hypothetical protein
MPLPPERCFEEMTPQEIQNKFQTLRDTTAQVDTMISDKATLIPIKDSLNDAEYSLGQWQQAPDAGNAPMWLGRVELQLRLAEKQLKRVQESNLQRTA